MVMMFHSGGLLTGLAFTGGNGGLIVAAGDAVGCGVGRGFAGDGRGVATGSVPISPLCIICETLFLLISKSKLPFEPALPPLRTFTDLPFTAISRLAARTFASPMRIEF